MIMSWTEPSKIRGAVQSLADLSFYFGHFGVIQQTQSWSFEVLDLQCFAFQIGHIEKGKVTKFGVIWRPF